MKKYVVGGNEFKNEQGLKDYFITKYSLSDDQKINLEKEIINGKSFEFMGEFIEIVMDQYQEQDAVSLDKKVEEIKQQEKEEQASFSLKKTIKNTKKMKSQGMKL